MTTDSIQLPCGATLEMRDGEPVAIKMPVGLNVWEGRARYEAERASGWILRVAPRWLPTGDGYDIAPVMQKERP